jgi:hypothetical protein
LVFWDAYLYQKEKLMTRRNAWPWLAALGLLAALADTGQAQTRYSYSVNGAEVTDNKTGLIWQRCSVGQAWSAGTAMCTGTAATYTHEAALNYAKTQTGWRLPNVKELYSITDKTRSDPVVDVTAFPATPSNWFWTSTPYAGDPSYAWYVSFGNGSGSVFGGYRLNTYLVRLVR